MQYTPTEEDATSSGGDSSEIHSRSLSMSSRKRLSNLFKSLSLKKNRKPKENGNPEADESVHNHDGSYNGGNNGDTVSNFSLSKKCHFLSKAGQKIKKSSVKKIREIKYSKSKIFSLKLHFWQF